VTHSTVPLPVQGSVGPYRGASPHDRKALYQVALLVALLLLTVAVSLYKGQDVFIFAYIVAIIYALRGPVRHRRSWQELGIKGGFLKDLRLVWPYSATVAILFQVLPPTLALAFVFGYGRELVEHITARFPIGLGSQEGAPAVAGLLAAALVLTLIEEIVYRVTIQERLSWFIGTPAAIVVASVIFGLAHAVGTSGSPQVILTDVAGVVLDGVFFGIIYAKTHNLAVTWATHYAADVVGLLALAFFW
jgi:membrane protease YdiL (CAAX protease family)